jgi:ELWxxDGT repeat protein
MRRLGAICAAAALAALAASAPAQAAGSPQLIKDINPTGSSNPSQMTVVGSTLYFAANDGVHGNELWKSDGTAAGTKMVKNIRPLGKSSNPENLVNVNGTLFFTANDGTHGRELWKSNGTAAGTRMVKDLNTAPKNSYGGTDTYIHEDGAFAIGNRLFFFVDWCCVGTSGLYVSDGTAAGTRQVSGVGDPILELPETASVGTAGGKLYFVTGFLDYSSYESQLWFSDGTTGPGTRRVNGSPATDWENPISILPTSGQRLYFYADGQLWRTNGTAAGTKALTTAGALISAPTESVMLSSRLYFNGGGLWKTDGSPSGTKKISAGEVSWLTSVGGSLYFTRADHLWRSDGTSAGTTDLGQYGIYGPSSLIAVGSELCFVAVGNSGWALWESDGSAAGTYQVRSFVGTPGELQQAAIGSRMYFAANDGVKSTELWSYTP